ncbi:MAG: type IX secretion system plug protein domain-containing protein, partial [Bacteroidota bacterium]
MIHCSFTNLLCTSVRALVLLLLVSCGLSAQDEDLKFYDNTYVDYIKTVRLHIAGFPHSYPMIELNGNAQLRLSFDDLSDEVRRYSYKFIHCDANWEPSGLSPLDFNSGYAIDYLDDYDFSLRTLKEYI